jgi:hypothetical protein
VTGRTGRGARRLYGLKRLLPIRAETTAVRRRIPRGQRGRPKRILTAPFAELADDPRAAAGITPDAEPVEPARLAAVSFDFDALDRLVAAADERTRGVRRLLDRIARGEKPFPPDDGTDEP